jgi:hypothetical protein
MNYFTELYFSKYETIFSELQKLLENKSIDWGSQNQICLTSTESDPANYHLGAGSLAFDWLNADLQYKNGSTEITPLSITEPLKESDFNTLCDQFKGTIFDEIYTMLISKYKIGRIRLIQLHPKTCLSWHEDNTIRLHYPIKTQEGCLMIIENTVFHMPEHSWWLTNTKVKHTALNSSRQSRIHLVCSVLN